MPIIHVARKKWLLRNTKALLDTINEKVNDAIVVNVGSGLDWLIPFISKDQTYKNMHFAEADFKSIIATKRKMLGNKRVFINETFEPKIDYFPINVMENGIASILEYYKLDNLKKQAPLVIIFEGVLCYTDQTTIRKIFKQLNTYKQATFIIADWEICMNGFNHHPEQDSGLFRLFRSLRQNRNLKEEHDDISIEKYRGKFNSEDFKELLYKYHFNVIEPKSDEMFALSEDAIANDLILNSQKEKPKLYFNLLKRKTKKLEASEYLQRDMGYLMVLANEAGKALLSNRT